MRNLAVTFRLWCLIALLGLASLLTGCAPNTQGEAAGSSVISLGYQEDGRVFTMEGEWEFYWDQLYTPRDFAHPEKLTPHSLQTVPKSWTAYQDEAGNNYPAHGVATYRKVFTMEEPPYRMSVYIPKIWSASKVWLNGELISARGKISREEEGFENLILENQVDLMGQPEVEIVVQVANHSLFLSGMIQPLEVGYPERMHNRYNTRSALALLWMGGLLIMGFYHFVLFVFRKKNPMTLYFGIICLLVLVRLIVFGDHAIYGYLKGQSGWLSFDLQSTIYYGSTFLLIPVGLRYLRQLYPTENRKRLSRGLELVTLAYSAFVVVAPSSLFGPTIVPFQFILVLAVIYMTGVIFLAAWRKEKEGRLQAAGISVMILAGINDALHSIGIELTGWAETIPWAFAVFLFMQIFFIAKRIADAFNETEELSINLEKKVVERTAEVVAQKEEIERQNKDIRDSINYAQRIQEAMLPPATAVQELFPDSYILFWPRDTVSGDFYFATEAFVDGNRYKVIAAVDCTGHGVPGAFMSMIGSTILQKILFDQHIVEPAQILTELDKEVRASLKQNVTHNRDGMDMAVCTIDCSNNRLHYAGARNPLVLLKGGKVTVIKAERVNIGGVENQPDRPFVQHTIDIDEPTSFYIFSDGYQDQMGGPRGKKFKFKNMQALFEEVGHLPMAEQLPVMETTLRNWMGDQESQIDDVLLMGVRLAPKQP